MGRFKILVILFTLTTVTFSKNLGGYIGFNSSWIKYDSKGISKSFRPDGVKLIAGYTFKEFSYFSFGIEGSWLKGVSSDYREVAVKSDGSTFHEASISVNNIYSIFIKTSLNVNKYLNANLYLGGSRGKVKASSNEYVSKRGFENSFSYGVGVELKTSKEFSYYINYMKYFKNLSAIEVGALVKF